MTELLTALFQQECAAFFNSAHTQDLKVTRPPRLSRENSQLKMLPLGELALEFRIRKIELPRSPMYFLSLCINRNHKANTYRVSLPHLPTGMLLKDHHCNQLFRTSRLLKGRSPKKIYGAMAQHGAVLENTR